jgi:DNA-3-methyladenine glycosylase II
VQDASNPTPLDSETFNSKTLNSEAFDSEQDALTHLQTSDPRLGEVIRRIGRLEAGVSRPEDHFAALARIIVGQQLSTTVARVIWNRVDEFCQGVPTPHVIEAASDESLRALGLSRQKIGYLRSLAEHVREEKLNLSAVESMPDEDIIREITAVKGLGRWSADMWLMFHLKRADILPVGDLGIQEGMRRLYNLEARPKPAEMERVAEPWRPYRTLACRYLWRFLDEKP